jgi:phage baseplate assembly protein W
MADEIQTFLGTGWGFPPSFDKAAKNVKMVADIIDIAESIHIILATIPGERLMQPQFGCSLIRTVFEQTDSNLVTSLSHLIYHALLDFEPRIVFLGIEVLDLNGLNGILSIRVDYSIIITNTRHNIVFPFYLIEGTNLSSTDFKNNLANE